MYRKQNKQNKPKLKTEIKHTYTHMCIYTYIYIHTEKIMFSFPSLPRFSSKITTVDP